MDRRFLGILGAIVIIFIGIFAISQKSNNNSTNTNSSAKPTTHVQGENSKGVTLVEYGDYECPICAAYNPTVDQVEQQFSKEILYQFRNLPLTSIHQNAFAGARAAEAAGLQNKYFQMHQKLYDNQNSWASSSNPLDLFTQYAQQIGLNINQFKTDYASNAVNDAINADISAFDKTGQEKATPSFFLDGTYIPNSSLVDPQTGAPSADKFAAIINAEISKKSGTSNQ